ncbi:MAG: glutathione S-transferase family protein [Rhodospirillaceae bacterium]|nr:glutathione S-transferase family protein [Rhodospirillaceae bacterium]
MPADLHLIIANKAYSSWSMRPWLALKANGVAFRETVIALDLPDTAGKIKAYSAAGKVPVLQHGDITVWESLAILDYLAETFPDKAWWPSDRQARATARSVATEMHGGFSSLRQAMPMNVRKVFPASAPTDAVAADIARITAIWRECRETFGRGGPFLFGAFSNADAMYGPVVTRFKTYSVALDPVSQAYSDAVLNHPAMREWCISAAGEPWIITKYENR